MIDALDAHRDPGWIPPDHRRTAGRVWNVEALLAFRDGMVELLGRGMPAGGGAEPAAPGSPSTVGLPEGDAPAGHPAPWSE